MRYLRPNERQMLLRALLDLDVAPEEVCRQAVDRCRLSCQLPSIFEIEGPKTGVAYVALSSRASGITIGADVFVRSEYFDADDNIPIRLLAHEVAHVAQFLRDGYVQFLARYLLDYLVGLATGRGDRQAYLDISYEREARRVAEHIAPAPG